MCPCVYPTDSRTVRRFPAATLESNCRGSQGDPKVVSMGVESTATEKDLRSGQGHACRGRIGQRSACPVCRPLRSQFGKVSVVASCFDIFALHDSQIGRQNVVMHRRHRARFRPARKSPFGEAQPGTGGDGIWTNRAGCRGRSDVARTGSGLDGLLAGCANPLRRPSAEHRRELPDCVNGEVKQAQQIVPG